MTLTEAINVLIQGVELGRKNAVYSFDDAALISQAIHLLTDNNNIENIEKLLKKPNASTKPTEVQSVQKVK